MSNPISSIPISSEPFGLATSLTPARHRQDMYGQLDSSQREIRLLQLVGGSDNGLIQCSLRPVRLDEPDLEFAALSYVWGDESITRDVLVDGHLRAVTTNLESALRNFWRYFTENGVGVSMRGELLSLLANKPNGVTSLRQSLSSEHSDLHHESDADEGTNSEDECGVNGTSNRPNIKNKLFVGRINAASQRARVGGGYLPIWIDALCINQDDLVERSQQVAMMRDIYAKAACVFSWLGPFGYKKLDLALSTIRRLAVRVRDGYSTAQLMQDYPELCEAQSDFPPFNKYWEAISNLAEAEYFERLWIFQELWAADWDNAIVLCGDEHLPMGSLIRYRAWANSLRRQRFFDTSFFDRSVPNIPLLTQLRVIKAGRVDAIGTTRLFLEIIRRSRCKNPRDKVFALSGIFPMDLTPDYTMPVADVYAAWATNAHQDLPLGSLLFYSGIGLLPRTLAAHNLTSWQPDFALLGEQIIWYDFVYAYKYLSVGTPAQYEPTVSPSRHFTCFGVRVTKVGEIVSHAGKKTVDFTKPTGSTIKDHVIQGTSAMVLLKYLIDNRSTLWADDYHKKESPLHALVETVNESTDGGDPPTSRLLDDTLREFTPYDLFMKVLSARDGPSNFTVSELKFFGFQSDNELWECLAGMSSLPECDDGNSATELREDQKNALLGFVSRLFTFTFYKTLFHTANGRVGGGPPGTETQDLVYLIHGCSLPVLLREVEGTGEFRHVGVCYIPGLSGTDAFRILGERESAVRELTLV